MTIFIGRETKIHIFQTKIDENKIAKVSPSNNNYSFSISTGHKPPCHSGELKHALTQAGGPTQSQLSRSMSSRHHIFMEHRQRRKQLNLILVPQIKHIWKKYKKQEKKKLFSLEKKKKEKNYKIKKKRKKIHMDKEKKGKEGPKRYHPKRLKKMIFWKEMLQEILKQVRQKKNQISRNPEKKKTKKSKKKKKNKKKEEKRRK